MEDHLVETIRPIAAEIGALMAGAFERLGGQQPHPGSALDQVGLLDGVEVVEDYLDHPPTPSAQAGVRLAITTTRPTLVHGYCSLAQG